MIDTEAVWSDILARKNPLEAADQCWTWPGAKVGRGGYGKVLRQDGTWKRTLLVHRVALAVKLGVSIDDLDGEAMHDVCDNPPCFNPAHLELGTHAYNMNQMSVRGRVAAANVCQRCGRPKPPGRCAPCVELKAERRRVRQREAYARKRAS